MKKIPPGITKDGIDALFSTIKHMQDAKKDYEIVKEEEKSKRKAITSDEKKFLAELAAKKEIILQYLDKSFDERKNNFLELFSRLDLTLENDQVEETALLLKSITDLAVSSPFKDLANLDNLKKDLLNKEKEILL
jgi:hypothetical protein